MTVLTPQTPLLLLLRSAEEYVTYTEDLCVEHPVGAYTDALVKILASPEERKELLQNWANYIAIDLKGGPLQLFYYKGWLGRQWTIITPLNPLQCNPWVVEYSDWETTWWHPNRY